MALVDPHSYADDTQAVTKHLRLHLAVDFERKRIEGRAVLELAAPAGGPMDLDTKAIIAKVNREDLWREAAKAIGVAPADMPAAPSRGKETFFDGKVFDPADPAAYLASLQIKKVA